MQFNLLALAALYAGSATAIFHARSFDEGYQAGLAARDSSYSQEDGLYVQDFDLEEDYLSTRDIDDLVEEYLFRRGNKVSKIGKVAKEAGKWAGDAVQGANDAKDQYVDSKVAQEMRKRPTFLQAMEAKKKAEGGSKKN